MAKRKPDPKAEALRSRGSLNPHPERVADPLFQTSDFFDARDLVQVKYEMVRQVQVDGQPVSHSAAAFGFSRPSFYQAQALLDTGGMAALVPRKPGPRRSHKLDPEVMAFIEQLRSEDASLRAADLAARVQKRFRRKVHPRSIERALERQEKKTPVIHSGCADAAAVYEQMRKHVFQGSPYGGHFGLILVIREGVAAWIDRGANGFTPAASTNVDRAAVLPALSPQLHACIVDVLVNIALSTREEMNT